MPEKDPKKQFKLTLAEYEALKAKKNRKGKGMPAAVKYILMTPLLIIFCFGLFFIPFLLFKVAMGWK